MTTKLGMIILAMGLGVATMAGCSSSKKQADVDPVVRTETYTAPIAVQNQNQPQQIASLGASSSGLSH